MTREESNSPPKIPRIIIILGYIFSLLFFPLLWIDTQSDPVSHAIAGMALGLLVFWMLIAAGIQRLIRDKLPQIQDNILLKFTILATVLALIEEAITTTMTNLARPVWHVSPQDAHITASTNYFEVVLLNSVIVFIPMFLYWGYMLQRYDFHHLWVYLLFGITGTLAETLSFGPSNLLSIGFWLNIYGLIVYLPAYLIKDQDRSKPPRYLYLGSIFLPLIVALPVVIVVLIIRSVLGI